MKFLAKWRVRKPADDNETVYVSERFGVRSLHIGSDTIQSSMRLARPYDLELSYTRSMVAFLLFNAHPQRIVMIGLGGGSLAKFVYHRMPAVATTVVEVNARVVAIARQYFHVPPDDARFAVVIGDGAQYVAAKRAFADVLMVDGYDAESQVTGLSTRTFYAACAEALTECGVFVVNLWGSDRRFGDYLARIEAAFRGGTLCLPAEKPGNVIVLGFRRHPGDPSWSELAARARELESAYGLEFPRFVQSLRRMNRHDKARLYVDRPEAQQGPLAGTA